ncbi:MAG: tetratricopeptide repeat protein [Bacteroidales bacterium]|nr:tetratricopeptide repeat protein [Bacteroidales bacterium]
MEFQSKIVDLLDKGKADEAIELATEFLTQTHAPKDQLYYLRGNAYRKKGDWQHALNDYLEAITINPESPAKHAYDMAIDILNFFNKDMYNQ